VIARVQVLEEDFVMDTGSCWLCMSKTRMEPITSLEKT
jgi:hypothetical protein